MNIRLRADTASIVCGTLLLMGCSTGDQSSGAGSAPVQQPEPVVDAVAVWYDESGLHRGDVVERTPVDLIEPERALDEGTVEPAHGALALVRTGALYLDPATGDVWFHPWDGEPRIVGRDSAVGPGGDPHGDTAAWFESDDPYGRAAGLVVFDTATGRVVSRTPQRVTAPQSPSGDHYPMGNTILQVSEERVVWRAHAETYVHDIRSRTTELVATATRQRMLTDVHDTVKVYAERDALLVENVPDPAEGRYAHMGWAAKLSPSGGFVLAVEYTPERYGATIVDADTGELWRPPMNGFPWIAWSYGDMALVELETKVLACDTARRVCERLPVEGQALMPTH
jgi:hypothetical protein